MVDRARALDGMRLGIKNLARFRDPSLESGAHSFYVPRLARHAQRFSLSSERSSVMGRGEAV